VAGTVIDRVRVVPGSGGEPHACANVVLDDDGVVTAIEPCAGEADRILVPAAVDLHLDNLRERRRPRATVVLDQAGVLAGLDAECAAAGIGTVCVAARCEESPGKGIFAADAVELAEILEGLASTLACDWRLHVRCEVTDEVALDTMRAVLAASSRVALVSFMEHSINRTRFASAEEHRAFYAADWGVSPEEIDRILAETEAEVPLAEERRREVARMAAEAGILLASHDDRDAEDVEQSHALGATIAEFPLSPGAAVRAAELGMVRVLGAPNAVRGRSTSPGNLLVADAVRDGLVDVLCADYLPSSIGQAPWSLAARGVAAVEDLIDLVAANPARALGLPVPRIEVGAPLSASLRRLVGGTDIGLGLWREGRCTWQRNGALVGAGSAA
jgi:alpha-D-ribose 1-methylphosphonate 5-triphosphate diphosphatase